MKRGYALAIGGFVIFAAGAIAGHPSLPRG